MKNLIESIFQALHPALQNDLALTMSEGAIKVRIVEYLLRSGHTIVESVAGGKRSISFADGRIWTVPVQPTGMAVPPVGERTSPDIRITYPVPYILELQVRSDIGSQSSIFSDHIVKDIARVAMHKTADLFILIADGGVYERMIDNSARNGRKRKQPGMLSALASQSKVYKIHTSFYTTRYALFFSGW